MRPESSPDLALGGLGPNGVAAPLDALTVTCARGGTVAVRDGRLRVYAEGGVAHGGRFVWRAGGALGLQSARLTGADGRVLGETGYRLAAETRLDDGSGAFARLLDLLRETLFVSEGGSGDYFRIGRKFDKFYIGWLRDHVHALKGMKYFDADPRLQSAIDLSWGAWSCITKTARPMRDTYV